MKEPNLGDYLLWKGQLAKVIGETSQRTIFIELIEDQKCPHCNGNLGKKQIDVIPTSPLFQENAQPVKSMDDGDAIYRIDTVYIVRNQSGSIRGCFDSIEKAEYYRDGNSGLIIQQLSIG